MNQITIWGDFKADDVKNLKISEDLQQLLQSSEINCINFEGPIRSNGVPIKKSGPNISQDPNAPRWLEDHGFNLINFANNHIMDFGNCGLDETINSFKKAGTIGAGSYYEAYQKRIIKTNSGIRIGFLSASHCEFGCLTESGYEGKGYAWCFSPKFERNIKEKNNIDLLVIINHGGIEYMDAPLPEWRETYKKWIDWGADAVICCHPHVPQGWEYYKNKPIIYSLGNACFDLKKHNNSFWYYGLCCILNIQEDKKIDLQMKVINYCSQERVIKLCTDPKITKHLEDINKILVDDKIYRNYVDDYVLKLYKTYKKLFTRGGWLATLDMISIAKGLKERFKKEHIFNTMRCESHRWAILRAMRIKHNIYS